MEAFFESLPVWLNVAIFAAGAAAIAWGADRFTDGAVGIAEATKIPKVVVGATVVSLATTFPEFSVSFTASLLSRPATAVGNAVGSTICNIGLILALGAFIRAIPISHKTLRVQGFSMLAAGGLLIALVWDGTLGRVGGMVLLAGMVAYLWASTHFSGWEGGWEDETAGGSGRPAAVMGWFVLGSVGVVGGSVLLVQSAAPLARALGVPELVIGLTLVAVGTSLPELVTGVNSARKGHGDISAGNVLGANTLNIVWVLGAASVVAPMPIARQTIVLDLPAMTAMMSLFVGWGIVRGRVGRPAGAVMFLAYVVYLAVMFTRFT